MCHPKSMDKAAAVKLSINATHKWSSASEQKTTGTSSKESQVYFAITYTQPSKVN